MSRFIAPEFIAYLIIGIYTLICSNQVRFGEWIRIKKDYLTLATISTASKVSVGLENESLITRSLHLSSDCRKLCALMVQVFRCLKFDFLAWIDNQT
jgi:hypothetical protein